MFRRGVALLVLVSSPACAGLGDDNPGPVDVSIARDAADGAIAADAAVVPDATAEASADAPEVSPPVDAMADTRVTDDGTVDSGIITAETAVADAAVGDTALDDTAIEDSAIEDSGRDEGSDVADEGADTPSSTCSKPSQCPQVSHATNAQCVAGTCRVAKCQGSYQDCNGVFVDGCESNRLTDARHCGQCGKACSATETCVAGVCTP